MKNIFKNLFGKEKKSPEKKEKPYFSDVLLVTDFELDFRVPQNETQPVIPTPKQKVKPDMPVEKKVSQLQQVNQKQNANIEFIDYNKKFIPLHSKTKTNYENISI
jgi:hypothetical protein